MQEVQDHIVRDAGQHDHCSAHCGNDEWHTQPDEIGLFQIYPSCPTHIPTDTGLTIVTDAPTLEQQKQHHQPWTY